MSQPSFKVMKATVALLQANVFLVVGTLKAETLTKEQAQLVYSVIMARDMTTAMLKNNPTRRNMMILCGAWRRFATQMQALVPEDQASVGETLKAALVEAEWMAPFDAPKEETGASDGRA